jgi:gluconolactonase
VVIRKDGSLYFTDPPYGLVDDTGKPIPQEIPFQGVYLLAAGSSQLSLVVDDFDRPNGLAFSADESLLYIDDTARGHIRVFQVGKDGSLSNSEVFAELTGEEPGVPDGMKVDTAGNVYCTGPGGVWIFSTNGEKIGLINTPEVAANVAFGETDWQTLFITATSSVYKIRISIPGMPVFS